MTNYTIYRLFDYETGLYVGGEFSHAKDFFEYHVEHTFVSDGRINLQWGLIEYLNPDYCGEKIGVIAGINRNPHYRQGVFRTRYSIKDAYGQNYPDPQGLYRLAYPEKFKGWSRGRWIYDLDWDRPLIFVPKNNVHKLKSETWSWFYRGVRTTNEMRQNNAHVNEHGQNVVRGKRRSRNLPSSWDDRPNSRWSTRKSWKHNSKRRHQWK